MFKVYYEPFYLQLLNIEPSSEAHSPTLKENNGVHIFDTFKNWACSSPKSDLMVATQDPESAWIQLLARFLQIEAAGGLVENPHKEIMMIKRLGKWDLPKGKPEGHESTVQTAIREVKEECGIGGLEVVASLPTTRHAYLDNNQVWVLKTTYWYHMTAKNWQHPIPQKNESISQAKWVEKKQASQLKKHAFRSIADLLDHFLLDIQ